MKETTRKILLLWFERFERYHICNILPDRLYLKIAYRLKLNKSLNLQNPKTFNEKLQWMKLNDRKQIYTQMVDKHAVKDLVAKKIGSEYVIPTLGVWSRFDDIDFDLLPNEFVLKCTHDSGGLIICRDKEKMDKNAAKKKIQKSLKTNYYLRGREWPYKHVRPRIIAEKFMKDSGGQAETGLTDYKFFCFNGEPKVMFVATDRSKVNLETKFDFFDMQFNHLPFTNGHPNSDKTIEKPSNFDLMIELAGKLSEGIPQVRVDFYESEGKVYFGELTFFHWSGLVPFDPEEWDEKFGDWIDLAMIK